MSKPLRLYRKGMSQGHDNNLPIDGISILVQERGHVDIQDLPPLRME